VGEGVRNEYQEINRHDNERLRDALSIIQEFMPGSVVTSAEKFTELREYKQLWDALFGEGQIVKWGRAAVVGQFFLWPTDAEEQINNLETPEALARALMEGE